MGEAIKIKSFIEHYAEINSHRKYTKINVKENKAMIKELCKILKDRLEFQGSLPFCDIYAGLAQTATYKTVDENGNPLTIRLPVSYHTNIEDCTGSPEKFLTPDSSKKGIIYFEESGGAVQTRRIAGGFTSWTAQLILVGWFNRKLITGDEFSEITTVAHGQIMEKLRKSDIKAPFSHINVKDLRVRQDPAIFTKYSYDETVLQHLRPPFEYFAIDLSVNFIIKGTCLPDLIINPNYC